MPEGYDVSDHATYGVGYCTIAWYNFYQPISVGYPVMKRDAGYKQNSPDYRKTGSLSSTLQPSREAIKVGCALSGFVKFVHIPNLSTPRELGNGSKNQNLDRKSLKKYQSIQNMSAEKTYTVIIEQDGDGIYVAKVPSISCCYTQGKTVAEATDRIKEAISSCNKDEDIQPLKFVGIQQIQA